MALPPSYPVFHPDMGISSGESQPVYSPQDIANRVRDAREFKQNQINQAAQQLYDYYQNNPMQWDTTGYKYGGIQQVLAQNGDGSVQPAYIPSGGNNEYGIVRGGSYTPTLADATALVKGYLSSAPSTGNIGLQQPSPYDVISHQFGSGLPQGLQQYLAANSITKQGDTTWNQISPTFADDTNSLPNVFKGNVGKIIGSDLSNAGIGGGFGRYMRNFDPTSYGANAEGMAQANGAANTAYQNETLGGNYAGGILTDKYSNPFGDVTSTFDPNNPLGPNSSSGLWQTPSYGGPNSGEMALRPTGQYGAFGGLGGLGGGNTQSNALGGPWGANNPWSPR